ncbi:MAG: flippase-like domain-containing protein [Candidatus Omnitrophica bacterium]|nr:flippase-like domain-containing protein [Candidatus Omnitrophota bacterium]
MRGSLVWWLRFAGIAAFLTILLVQLPRSQEVHLSRIDLRWLGLCMLLTIGQLLLEALVWQWLLSAQRIRHPYPKTLVAYLASQYLGLVTPGHVGEFLAAGYISMNTGITFGYALSSVVMKKVLFWLTIVGFGIWGLPLLADMSFLRGVQGIAWATLGVLVALSVGITLWVLSLRRLARKWQKLSPWKVDMTEFWSGIRHLCSLRLVGPLGLAVLAFSILFVQFDAVLRAMGLALPFLLVGRIMALSRIAARLIPISVVGFGAKDAAIIVLLSQQDIALPVGLTATLLFLLCSYLVTLLLSGVCWWIKPLVIRRVAPSSS